MSYGNPTHTCLKAPEFVAWLREKGVKPPVRSPEERKLYRWEKEAEIVTVYAADRVLLNYGLHPIDVPDELWCEAQKRSTGPRWTREERRPLVRRAVELRSEGCTLREIGRELGTTHTTVHRLLKEGAECVS